MIMELSFFLNWMGVINTHWYEENKIPFTLEKKHSLLLDEEVILKHYHTYYSCGRIDVSGHPEHPFGFEYSVGVMDNESWYKLGYWLDNLVLPYLPDSVEEIFDMFEKDTGFKINWWNGGSDEIY